MIVPVLPAPADPIPLLRGGNNDVSLLNGSDVRGRVSGQLNYSKSRTKKKKHQQFLQQAEISLSPGRSSYFAQIAWLMIQCSGKLSRRKLFQIAHKKSAMSQLPISQSHWSLPLFGNKPRKLDFVHQTVSRREAREVWA